MTDLGGGGGRSLPFPRGSIKVFKPTSEVLMGWDLGQGHLDNKDLDNEYQESSAWAKARDRHSAAQAALIHESRWVKVFNVSIAGPESDLTFFCIFELVQTSFSNLANISLHSF